jgi:hypothetical protein
MMTCMKLIISSATPPAAAFVDFAEDDRFARLYDDVSASDKSTGSYVAGTDVAQEGLKREIAYVNRPSRKKNERVMVALRGGCSRSREVDSVARSGRYMV